MQTKLTLRLDDRLVRRAKEEAYKRGKSVSMMVAEYFDELGSSPRKRREDLPPITKSLVGVLRGKRVSEEDHKRHLMEKHR